jgi:hypothetical protein
MQLKMICRRALARDELEGGDASWHTRAGARVGLRGCEFLVTQCVSEEEHAASLTLRVTLATFIRKTLNNSQPLRPERDVM